MGRLSENSVVSIKNKSFSVTAEIEVPTDGAEGVIIAQGGRFGGWALYAKDGKPSSSTTCSASRSSPPRPTSRSRPASTRCAWSSPTTAAGWPRAATSPSTTTATPSAPGRVEATQPMIFSADETTDIGYESGTTVTPDYTAPTSRFTGKIHWVQIDLGDDDHDHFIDPDERFRISPRNKRPVPPGPPYPESHRDLLEAANVAVFTAVTPRGQLQSTAIWYLLDDDRKLKMTSTGDRRKVRNLQADPRVALLFMDPTNPYRTLEVRGTATTELDVDLVLQKKIGVKYDDDVTSHDAPDTVRYVITIQPETVNPSG